MQEDYVLILVQEVSILCGRIGKHLSNYMYFLDITYSDLITAQPFGNTVDIGDIQGKYLKEMFEHTTKEYNVGRTYSSLSLIQLSGESVLHLRKFTNFL